MQGTSAALAASVKHVSSAVSACQQDGEGVKKGLGHDTTIPVKILDTGAVDSYIASSALPFPQETSTGDHVYLENWFDGSVCAAAKTCASL